MVLVTISRYRSCATLIYEAIRPTAVVIVCWLFNVPATCKCISGTDLLRQFYVLPHWDRSCSKTRPQKYPRRKRDSNLGSSALEADALTTRPTRRSPTAVLLTGGSGRLAWNIIQQHPHIYMTVYDTPRIIDTIEKPFTINMNLRFVKGLLPLCSSRCGDGRGWRWW